MNAVAGASTAAVKRGPPASPRPTHYGLALATLCLVGGWFAPLDYYLTPRSGLGYWLGILGGALMLLLLVYPLRKRVPALAVIGGQRVWFQIHMVFGVAGPLCVLYHCAYRMGATNSNVALFSMLVVSGSGLVGRYLYGRIHHGLYGEKATLGELRADAERLRGGGTGAARVLPEFAERLAAAEARIARGIRPLPRAVSAALLYRLARADLRRHVRAALAAQSGVAGHERGLAAAADRYADARLGAARRIAEFESCASLFGLWHVLHLPLFGLLFVAGIVHVVAVNLY